MPEPHDPLAVAAVEACTAPGVLRAHFQPIVDLARGVVTGYEALARFAGPPDASPDKWFAAAHRAGVGTRLEARALKTALDGRTFLPDNCFLTVNLGPDAVMAPEVQDVLEASGDLRGLVIEVTEQAPVEDYPALLAVLDALRARGAMLAVDDAGAGFASLAHIVSLRPDFVKLDRGLVAGLDADETKAAVVETFGIFASRIDAWLIAEGVETDAELERLISLGVPLAQGYRLARPAPAMGDIAYDAARLCRARSRSAASSDLLRIVEPSTGGWLVTLDEHKRPVELSHRDHGRAAPLCVLTTDRLADVARRVATRDAAARFVPIAVCDDLGRMIGLASVDRLLSALADVADGVVHDDAPVERPRILRAS